jgi:hypothetical protein
MRYRELLLNRFSGFAAAVPLQNRPTGSNGPTYGGAMGHRRPPLHHDEPVALKVLDQLLGGQLGHEASAWW